MWSTILAVALLSITTSASVDQKRQATDDKQFTSAAEQLISQYIPSTALSALEAGVSSAASAANVAGEPLSLIYDALLAPSPPAWFESAVPSEWSAQIAALESGVDALRPTPASGPTVPIIIAITTTDSSGSTFTTSLTSTPSITGFGTTTSTEISGVTTTTNTILPVNGGSIYSSLTTQVIGGVTSVFETVVSGASSVATEASGVVSHASSVATEASGVVSHASSVATKVSGFLSSATSAGGASFPTAVSGAAAGVIGMVGFLIAL